MVVARKAFGGPIYKNIPIKKQEEENLFIPEVDNPTYCEVRFRPLNIRWIYVFVFISPFAFAWSSHILVFMTY